ncbi:MAG: flagellar hook-length control protein FliK [Deltaproteobacteria bacterium]|jgi:flagellar hook-length control protein FliK|nr:flagellar hook-length control protein FliK [Deltaproteobacteria bacterium]
MQFLPADDTQAYAQSMQNAFADNPQDFLGILGSRNGKAGRSGQANQDGNGLDFASLFSESREHWKNADGNEVVDKLAEWKNAPGSRAGRLASFNSENTPGIAPGLSSVKDDHGPFKSRDLNFLERQMRGQGLDEGMLQSFMSGLFNMNAAELPRVSQILGAAGRMSREGQALNEQEKIAFSSLMLRSGFNNEEIAGLEELSFQGKGVKVLHELQQRLAAKGGSDLLNMTREEAAALTKVLNLSAESAKQIMSKFGENTELKMNSDGFSKLFAEAGAELNREAANLAKLREITPDAVREMLQNAKLAERNAPVSDNRGNRRLERSEILMRDSAALLEEKDEDDDKAPAQRKSILTELNGKSDKAATEAGNAEAAAKNANQRGFGQGSERGEGRGESGYGRGEREYGQSDRQFGREHQPEFAESLKRDAANSSRLREMNGDSSATTQTGKEALASKLEAGSGAIFSLQTQSADSSTATQNVRTAVYHDRIFDQVEQGIIRNAINGSRQITLRLDPPDLGRLTLNLTVQNGEVKALIRAEQSEVTQVVSEQLAQIKASLEEQGLKVTSLEVETQTQSRAGTDDWSSAEQHNQQQQMEARAEFVRLARSRAKEGDTLARTMQNSNQPATITEAGLHLVA